MTTTLRTDSNNLAGAVSFRGVDNITLKTTGPELLGVPKAPTASTGTNTTQVATTAFVNASVQAAGGITPSNAVPVISGVTGTPGTAVTYSRGDHAHPAPLASSVPSTPTGTVTATNVQAAIAQLASATVAVPQPSNTTPLADGAVPTPGTSVLFSRGDHVHPQFTSASNATPALPSVAGTAGASSAFSRGDHAHPAGAQTLASNGYVTLPGGLILQWGFSTFSASGSAVNFPIPFPNAVYAVTATAETTGAVEAASVYSKTVNGFSGKTAGNLGCSWMATGR